MKIKNILIISIMFLLMLTSATAFNISDFGNHSETIDTSTGSTYSLTYANNYIYVGEYTTIRQFDSYQNISLSIERENNYTYTTETRQNDGIEFINGTDIWIINSYSAVSDRIFDYKLTKPYNISTTQISIDYTSLYNSEDNRDDLDISEDGYYLYSVGNDQDAVYNNYMTIPFNKSTLSSVDTSRCTLPQATYGTLWGIHYINSTLILIQTQIDTNTHNILQIEMSTPHDLSTCRIAETKQVYSTIGTNPRGITATPDLKNIYLINQNGDLFQYIIKDTSTNTYSVNNIQKPNNLTTLTIGTLYINSTVNDTLGEMNDLNNSYLEIDYKIRSNANSNCDLINQNTFSCESLDRIYNSTKINNSYYYYTMTESEFFPAIYPFDYLTIQNTPKLTKNIYNNNYLRFNVYNLSTTITNSAFLEYNINTTNILNPETLFVYYCNSSYTSGNFITSDNCLIIDEIDANSYYNHCHNVNSCHYVTKLSPNITWTENSSFIFRSPAVNMNNYFKARYLLNTSYNNNSFQHTGNGGISWSSTSNLYDIHLHQFNDDDNLNYTTTFYDGEGNSQESTRTIDYFDLVNFAPTPVNIIDPVENFSITINSTGVNITFSWLNTTDPDGDLFTYQVAVGFSSIILSNISPSLNDGVLNYTYSFNTASYSNGDYRAYVYATDIYGNRRISAQDHTFNICVNDWQEVEGVCFDGVRNITYSDANNCDAEYDIPQTYLENCSITNEDNEFLFIIILLLFFNIFLIYLSNSNNIKIGFIINIVLNITFLIYYVSEGNYDSTKFIQTISMVFILMLTLINALTFLKSSKK